jgi:hypothetical protein
MAPYERRPLTDAEIALARCVFSDEIAWAKARVMQIGPAPFMAMVPLGRTIVFARWRAARCFAHAPLGEQGWFIHELAHVWQAAKGVTLALAKLNALGVSAYEVQLKAGKPFSAYNIEQQAEIARAAFHERLEGRPGAFSALWPISS